MLRLTVQYSICPSILPSSQSAQSHVRAQCAQNHSSRRWKFLLAVWSASACQTSSTWRYFTPTSSAAQRLWKEAVSHPRSDKNSQTKNARRLAADNAEGRLQSGRNPIWSHIGGAIIPRGWIMGALSAGVRTPGKPVWLRGVSHCPWFWSVNTSTLLIHDATYAKTNTNKFRISQQNRIKSFYLIFFFWMRQWKYQTDSLRW